MDAVNDSYGYACENNIKERKKLVSVCDKHSMIDIWGDQNPGKQQYTQFTAAHGKGSRLDMFFVSSHLTGRCDDLKIHPGYRTDKNIVSMVVQSGESQRGPGLWKFNESLLKDDEYLEIVNICIRRTIEEYALPIYTREFMSNECNYGNIQFKIDDGLFDETFLMLIRGETIRYLKIKAKKKTQRERKRVDLKYSLNSLGILTH